MTRSSFASRTLCLKSQRGISNARLKNVSEYEQRDYDSFDWKKYSIKCLKFYNLKTRSLLQASEKSAGWGLLLWLCDVSDLHISAFAANVMQWISQQAFNVQSVSRNSNHPQPWNLIRIESENLVNDFRSSQMQYLPNLLKTFISLNTEIDCSILVSHAYTYFVCNRQWEVYLCNFHSYKIKKV